MDGGCGSISMDRYWNTVATPFLFIVIGFGLFVLFQLSEIQFMGKNAIMGLVATLPSPFSAHHVPAAKTPNKAANSPPPPSAPPPPPKPVNAPPAVNTTGELTANNTARAAAAMAALPNLPAAPPPPPKAATRVPRLAPPPK
jgi:hypothetical protein